jgi:hypothetical protein
VIKRVTAGLSIAVAVTFVAGPAGADGVDVPRHHVGHYLRLPPERHVVEVIDSWGRLIINGRRFTPAVPGCGDWVAGERIKFLAGDINGACDVAVIYNYRRHQTCEVGCRHFANW